MSDFPYPSYLYPNLCALQMLSEGVFSTRAINTYLLSYPWLIADSASLPFLVKQFDHEPLAVHGPSLSTTFSEMVKRGYLHGATKRGFRFNDTALRNKQLLQFLREYNNGRLQNFLQSA